MQGQGHAGYAISVPVCSTEGLSGESLLRSLGERPRRKAEGESGRRTLLQAMIIETLRVTRK